LNDLKEIKSGDNSETALEKYRKIEYYFPHVKKLKVKKNGNENTNEVKFSLIE
jgi:hypothetical protein